MSSQNSLQWICRRCMKTHPEVKVDHSTESLKVCSFCGVENWCFSVVSGRQVKRDEKAPKEPETGTNTTDTMVFDKLEVVEDVQIEETTEEVTGKEETLGTEAEGETPAEPEHDDDHSELPATEQPLETEPEPSSNVLSGDIDIGPLEDKIATKDAEIAELEAKLEALKK